MHRLQAAASLAISIVVPGCLGDPPEIPTFDEGSTGQPVLTSSTGEVGGSSSTDEGSTGPATSTTGDASSTTGEHAESSTTSPPDPFCGDGSLDPGELCDDGNADESDACTSACQPPRCDDGIVSGDELGLDCGGSCDPCVACTEHVECGTSRVCDQQLCRLPRSCAELHASHPGLRYTERELQPLAKGDPATFLCVADEDGGAAWTEVFEETAADGAHADWQLSGFGANGAGAFQCGDLGWVLGLFGSGANVQLPVFLADVPHTEARVLGEVLVADTWDSEQIAVSVDGQQVWSETCQHGTNSCGLGPHNCGIPGGDGLAAFDGRLTHAGANAQLRFSSNINSLQNDESFGVGTFRVWVR